MRYLGDMSYLSDSEEVVYLTYASAFGFSITSFNYLLTLTSALHFNSYYLTLFPILLALLIRARCVAGLLKHAWE